MESIKAINLGIRFLLELCLLASLGYAGFHVIHNTVLRWVVAILLPIAVATIWSLFVAPEASHLLNQPYRLLLELALFGAGIAGLYALHHKTLAAIFVTVVIINEVLLLLWKQ